VRQSAALACGNWEFSKRTRQRRAADGTKDFAQVPVQGKIEKRFSKFRQAHSDFLRSSNKRRSNGFTTSAALSDMTRKAFRGVLTNFLRAYTSRNSDSGGWWIFGLILDDLHKLDVDLLAVPAKTTNSGSLSEASQLAQTKFQDQAAKQGLKVSQLREARLAAQPLSGMKSGRVNGKIASGRDVRFQVSAVADDGQQFSADETVFVALHDAGVERQSMRATGLLARVRRLKNKIMGG
jgi:hypothetical protein